MKRNDFVYYAGWLTSLILLGVWMMLWAMGAVRLGEAALLWLLSVGILLVAISMMRTGSTSGASNIQLMTGLVLSVFMLIMLAVSSDIMGGFVGAAIGIILIGIIGLVLLMRNVRLEE